MSICTDVRLYVCELVCLSVCGGLYSCAFERLCVRAFVRWCACVVVWLCGCAYGLMCVCAFVHLYIRALVRLCGCAYVRLSACAFVRAGGMCVCLRACEFLCVCVCACVRLCVCGCAQKQLPPHKQLPTHTNTHSAQLTPALTRTQNSDSNTNGSGTAH